MGKYALPGDKQVDDFMKSIVAANPGAPPMFHQPIERNAVAPRSIHDRNAVNFEQVEKEHLSAYKAIENAIQAEKTERITVIETEPICDENGAIIFDKDGNMVTRRKRYTDWVKVPDWAQRIAAARAKLALCGMDPREAYVKVDQTTKTVSLNIGDVMEQMGRLSSQMPEEDQVKELLRIQDLERNGDITLFNNEANTNG